MSNVTVREPVEIQGKVVIGLDRRGATGDTVAVEMSLEDAARQLNMTVPELRLVIGLTED